MIGFYIVIAAAVLFVLWMGFEIKHAPLMPDDFDPRTQQEKILDKQQHKIK